VITESEAARYCGLSVVHFRRLRKSAGPTLRAAGCASDWVSCR
jgi:hypothetical protein